MESTRYDLAQSLELASFMPAIGVKFIDNLRVQCKGASFIVHLVKDIFEDRHFLRVPYGCIHLENSVLDFEKRTLTAKGRDFAVEFISKDQVVSTEDDT